MGRRLASRKITAFLAVLLLAAPLLPAPAAAAPTPLAAVPLNHTDYPLGSWKMFHANPEHTGEGDTTLPPQGHVVWSYRANSSDKPEGGAAVENGVVYVGLGAAMMAINATSGSRIWSFGAFARIFSTPALYNGMVLFGAEGAFGSRNFYALNQTTGGMVWAANETVDLGGGIHFVHGSPTAVNGLVYYGSFSYWLYARHAGNGSLAWSANLSSEVVSSPAESGGVVYATSAGIHNPVTSGWDVTPRLWAFNSTTGQELWNQSIAQGHLLASPVVAAGTVYAATAGFSYATTEVDSGYVLAFGALNGTPLWTSPDVGRMIATPAVYGSIMYVAGAGEIGGGTTSTGARLRWLDLANAGAVTGEQPVGDNASMESSPAAVAGRVVAAARDGAVAVFLASGARLWEFDLPGDIIAPVAVASEMIFVPALDGTLYAFGAQPDISIDPADITLDDSTPHVGEPLVARVVVRNIGDKKGSAVATVATDQGGAPTLLATWNITDLDKFSQIALTAPVRFASVGPANISVAISNVTPIDGQPLNNLATASFAIQPEVTGWSSRYADPHGSNFLETETPQNNVPLWRIDALNVTGGGFVAYGSTLVFADKSANRLIAVPRASGDNTSTWPWTWTAPAPILGSPVLGNGYLVVVTADASDPAGNATFIDTDTGAAARTVPLPARPTAAGVAYDDVVLLPATDRLVELSVASLSVVRSLPTVDVPPAARPALRSEPVVVPGWAFVLSSVGELHAFNLTTATEPAGWPTQLQSATSVPLTVGGGFLISANGPTNLSAFSLSPLSPVPVWNASVGENITGAMAVGYGRVFVPAERTVTAFVAGSGAVAWVQPLAMAQPQNAIRAAGNNTLYAGSERLYALSATTGVPEWDFEPGADGALTSSAALLGGTLHLQTVTGRVITLGLIPGRPPTAVIASPLAGHTYRARDPVLFSSEGTFDPDNDTLTYLWDLGDGNFSTNASELHTYAFAADLRVRLTVTDGLGLVSTRAFDIHVIENQAPLVTTPYLVQPDVTRQNLDSTVWTFRVRYSDPDNDPPAVISLNITGEAEPSKPLLPSAGAPYDFIDGVDYYWTGTLSSGNHTYHYEASDGLDYAPPSGSRNLSVYRVETRDAIQLTYSVMYVGTGNSVLTPVTGLIPPPEYGTIDKFSITLPANASLVQWIQLEFRYGTWVNISQFREETIAVYSITPGATAWNREDSVPLLESHTVVANLSFPVFTVEESSQLPTATFGIFGQPTVPPLAPEAVISPLGRNVFAPGETVTFSGVNSIEHNDGNTSNLTFVWHFNDGTADGHGAVVNHTFSTPGVYTVELVVINAFGQNHTAPVTITVRSEGTNTAFLGLAILIVGAIFALAVIFPVVRRRTRAGGVAERRREPPEPQGEAPRKRNSKSAAHRAHERHHEEDERDVIDQLGRELDEPQNER